MMMFFTLEGRLMSRVCAPNMCNNVLAATEECNDAPLKMGNCILGRRMPRNVLCSLVRTVFFFFFFFVVIHSEDGPHSKPLSLPAVCMQTDATRGLAPALIEAGAQSQTESIPST